MTSRMTVPDGERTGNARERSPPTSGDLSVLVIDDDLDIRCTIKKILDDEGYPTRMAANGADALEVLRGWTPRLILLDLMMPVMSGSAFRAIQLEDAVLASVPTVVMTARGDARTLVQGLHAEALMAKPFHLEALLGMVVRYCK